MRLLNVPFVTLFLLTVRNLLISFWW